MRCLTLYQLPKKLTLFGPLCFSRQKRFAFRPLRLYPEALSRCSRGRCEGRSRGPYTSEHKNHFQWPLVLLIITTLPAWASPPFIVNERDIDVTTTFRGTNIELTSFLEGENPQTKLVLVGPPVDLTFRRKARRMGMWVNAEKEILNAVASYVALIGFTKAEIDRACQTEALHELAHWGSPSLSWVCNPDQRALMAQKGLYVQNTGEGSQALGRGFFEITAFLPPTAKPGQYGLRFWADGQSAQTQLHVRRAGLERVVIETAENSRLFYGILCLALAALAGYVTNLIFSWRS